MTPDARYASWVEQFDLIVNDVYALHHHRHLFREIRDIAAAANLPSSTFFDAFGLWYASSQSAALRRLVDRRKGTVSLIRLLEDIARNPTVMNRDRHVGLWGNDRFFIAQGNRNFDRFAKASGDDTVDRDAVNADINAVNGIVSKVEKYVDENVAHRSARPTVAIPTFGELHDAIDVIGEVAQKYGSLLKAEMLAELEPVIQDDWLAPFRVPWLRNA